jgi:hypothetical protein
LSQRARFNIVLVLGRKVLHIGRRMFEHSWLELAPYSASIPKATSGNTLTLAHYDHRFDPDANNF